MDGKPRIFLLIGLTKESGHWDEAFLGTLRERFEPDRILGLDIPGNGSRNQESSPWSVGGMVEALRRSHLPDIQGWGGDRILISVSLGGMISTEWLIRHPGDFTHFAIVNSSFRGYSPLWRRVRPWAMKKFLQIFLARSPEQKEHHILDLCSNNPAVYAAVQEKWVGIARSRPVSALNILRQTVAGARYSPQGRPAIPTLLVCARHDKLAHYSCSLRAQERWGGQLRVIEEPHVGHGAHIDAPGLLANLIADWHADLTRVGQAGHSSRVDP